MSTDKEKKQQEDCPNCGLPWNGVECNHCSFGSLEMYTPYDHNEPYWD